MSKKAKKPVETPTEASEPVEAAIVELDPPSIAFSVALTAEQLAGLPSRAPSTKFARFCGNCRGGMQMSERACPRCTPARLLVENIASTPAVRS